MPYFLCRLATEDGQNLSQSFLASSADECRKHFESEGFCVLSIKKDWTKIPLPSLPFEKKIKRKDFILFNQELKALLKAGYPVLKSLEIIAKRVKNIHFKELLLRIESEIRAGKALSEAFTPFEKNFTKVYTASLMAGEQSANLPETIGRYIDYAKLVAQTRSKIRAALVYPTLLIVFSFTLLVVLVNFVLPRFATFYADFEAELPPITLLLIGFTEILRKVTPFVLLFLVILTLIIFRFKKGEKTNLIVEKMKLRIPYARAVWMETGISLFCRTLSLVLEAGITLLHAVPIASQAVPNKYLVRSLDHLAESIKNGETLSESLSRARFFSPLALDMIRIGETSANLPGMLKDVADVYDERVQATINTFVSLIEPIVIIFIGMVVAVMLLSVYLPIFNIIRVTR